MAWFIKCGLVDYPCWIWVYKIQTTTNKDNWGTKLKRKGCNSNINNCNYGSDNETRPSFRCFYSGFYGVNQKGGPIHLFLHRANQIINLHGLSISLIIPHKFSNCCEKKQRSETNRLFFNKLLLLSSDIIIYLANNPSCAKLLSCPEQRWRSSWLSCERKEKSRNVFSIRIICSWTDNHDFNFMSATIGLIHFIDRITWSFRKLSCVHLEFFWHSF